MKWHMTPLQAAAAVVVIVGISVPLVAWIEFRSNRENIDRMLYSKGNALMETLLHGAENAMTAHQELTDRLAERLADNAREILLLGSNPPPSDYALGRIVELNSLARVDVYAPNGSLAASSDRRRAPRVVPYQFENIEYAWIATAATLDPNDKEGPGARNDLFAAGVRSPGGWTAVAAAPAAELLDIQRRLGIGLILDDLSTVKGVSYAVLQDTLGIIAASSRVRDLGMESIRGDAFFPIPPYEIRGRYKEYSGEEIYELAASFQWAGESYGYLRVGLSTGEVHSIAALDRKRFILGMGVMAALLMVVSVLVFAGRSQARLQQEHARIKGLSDNVLQGMDEAVIVLDEKDRVLLYNEACRNLCGATQVSEGSPLSRINPALALAVSRLSRGWTSVSEIEMPRTNGSDNLPLLMSTSPLMVDGRMYTTIILSNLTDRRRAEDMALLSQKYKAMAEISAGVAHEIRNPLNAIAMNVQRLRIEFTPAVEERAEYQQFIGIVLAEVERMNRMVEQFMRLARFPEPRLQQGSLSVLLEDSLGFLAPEIQSRGVALDKNLDQAPQSMFDPDQLGQVISNLVRNALQSMENGGELRVSGRIQNGSYQVIVADNGPGIPEKESGRIFEPFFSTRRQGLGLGLAIVQRIVNEHGGSIQVESTPGKGASFIFALPLRAIS